MQRRTLLGAGLASGAAAACATTPELSSSINLASAKFVLVHGAWHGGWCWRDVAALLRAQGAAVWTPTLTGLGERSHLRDPVPSLETHIVDILAVLQAEELSDVVLVGHSYGGMVVTGVADRAKARLRHVVYFDAAVPDDGDTMISQHPELTPAQIAQSVAQLTALAKEGWLPAFPASVFGITDAHPEAAAWVERRLTPHPLQTWLDPIRLTSGGSDGLPRTYVWCNAPALSPSSFSVHAARVRAGAAGAGWRSVDLAAGHDAMVTHPTETAAIFAAAWAG